MSAAVSSPASAQSESARTEVGEGYIVVEDLVVGYGGDVVVKGISIEISRGEHVSLLGPSGCGKTTTLRCVAGLERPIAGRISIDGRVVYSSEQGILVPPEARGLSMVFQSYAVWPHMTVFNNVAYGPRLRGLRGERLEHKVMDTLKLVGLEKFAKARATELSGGQQQRVALARSYATDPKALLLDEPLSNLDTQLRIRMRDELRELQKSLGMTTLYVTHDQEEAIALSDRIVVMSAGEVCQTGSPRAVYSKPQTSVVADFMGASNRYPGELRCSDDRWTFAIGDVAVVCAPPDIPAAESHDSYDRLAIRAVHGQLLREWPAESRENVWPARIVRKVWLGDFVEYCIEWPGGEFTLKSLVTNEYDEDEPLLLRLPPEYVIPVRA